MQNPSTDDVQCQCIPATSQSSTENQHVCRTIHSRKSRHDRANNYTCSTSPQRMIQRSKYSVILWSFLFATYHRLHQTPTRSQSRDCPNCKDRISNRTPTFRVLLRGPLSVKFSPWLKCVDTPVPIMWASYALPARRSIQVLCLQFWCMIKNSFWNRF